MRVYGMRKWLAFLHWALRKACGFDPEWGGVEIRAGKLLVAILSGFVLDLYGLLCVSLGYSPIPVKGPFLLAPLLLSFFVAIAIAQSFVFSDRRWLQYEKEFNRYSNAVRVTSGIGSLVLVFGAIVSVALCLKYLDEHFAQTIWP